MVYCFFFLSSLWKRTKPSIEKYTLCSKITDIRKEVERVESVISCIEKLLTRKQGTKTGKEERVRVVKLSKNINLTLIILSEINLILARWKNGLWLFL